MTGGVAGRSVAWVGSCSRRCSASLAIAGGSGSGPTSLPTSPPAAADRCGPGWVAAWEASPQPVPPDEPLAGRTLRMIVRPQATGSEVRLRLSNRFGTAPLAVGPVSAARAGAGATLVPGTVQPVSFGGRRAVVVDPGSELVSDPVRVVAEAGRPIAVSLMLPSTPDVVAEHPVALQTSYLSGPGDSSIDDEGAAFTTPIGSWLVLTGVDVLAPRPVNAVVAMGDSITDGVGSGIDTDTRWSDALSDRLARRGGAATMAVLNAGISRNELLADRGQVGGESPLVRIRREVAESPGHDRRRAAHRHQRHRRRPRRSTRSSTGSSGSPAIARAAGKRVFLTTITPSDTGPHGTPRAAGGPRRRSTGGCAEQRPEHADGVFDFAAAVADPARPGRLLGRYDAGDGLHLSEAGYRALADAVDVTRLTGSPCLADRSPARVALSDG